MSENKGNVRNTKRKTPAASMMLIKSFNGKPQALPTDFACAFGSPLNENDQYTTKSTERGWRLMSFKNRTLSGQQIGDALENSAPVHRSVSGWLQHDEDGFIPRLPKGHSSQ